MSVTLKSRLPQIAAELRPRVSAAVKDSAEQVAEAAKARVPVDTGRLRDAIHVERKGPAEYAVVAGDNQAWYGHLIEHGTTRQPPRPFLVPTLEEQRQPIELAITVVLRSL